MSASSGEGVTWKFIFWNKLRFYSLLNYTVRKSIRKTVHDCYSMDLFAYGFETQGLRPSNSLAMTANFISWNDAIIPDVLLMSFPDL